MKIQRSIDAEPDIDKALRVFVDGFAQVRSRTWPYHATRVGQLWRLHDAPRNTKAGHRKDEWIGHDVSASVFDETIRRTSSGRHAVGTLLTANEDSEAAKADFRSIGYRLIATEPLFVHDLKRVPRVASDAVIRIMKTEKDAQLLGTATRTRPVDASTIADAAYRQYLAFVDDKLVGRVRSIDTPDGQWCSDMYVSADYRRRGIGKALLAKMLRDDRRSGAEWNVLLSSHTGAMLYPTLGYKQIGTLFIFVPKKK